MQNLEFAVYKSGFGRFIPGDKAGKIQRIQKSDGPFVAVFLLSGNSEEEK